MGRFNQQHKKNVRDGVEKAVYREGVGTHGEKAKRHIMQMHFHDHLQDVYIHVHGRGRSRNYISSRAGFHATGSKITRLRINMKVNQNQKRSKCKCVTVHFVSSPSC